jgi:hypothetical protein
MRARALPVLLLAWFAPRPAAANHAIAFFRGERHGPLSPQRSSSVRVEREDLSFELPDDADDAQVTAVYRMKAEATESADVAFVFTRAAWSSQMMYSPSASVEVDGAPIEFRRLSDGEILEPRLRAWIEERPDLASALRAAIEARKKDPEEAERLLQTKGAPCTEGCSALRDWYELASLPG